MKVLSIKRSRLQWLVAVLASITLTACRQGSAAVTLSRADLAGYSHYQWQGDSSVLYFSENMKIHFLPVHLKRGRYSLVFEAAGQSAQGELPIYSIFLGDTHVIDKPVLEGLNHYRINFQTEEELNDSLSFRYVNDYSSKTEDRNVYLHFPVRIEPY